MSENCDSHLIASNFVNEVIRKCWEISTTSYFVDEVKLRRLFFNLVSDKVHFVKKSVCEGFSTFKVIIIKDLAEITLNERVENEFPLANKR